LDKWAVWPTMPKKSTIHQPGYYEDGG
jgi:hypothetical protein